jgi:hypothetical protein
MNGRRTQVLERPERPPLLDSLRHACALVEAPVRLALHVLLLLIFTLLAYVAEPASSAVVHHLIMATLYLSAIPDLAGSFAWGAARVPWFRSRAHTSTFDDAGSPAPGSTLMCRLKEQDW